MLRSHKALGLPTFDVEEMIKCTAALLDIERDWLRRKPWYSLYLRPVSISMDNRLGLDTVDKMMTFITVGPAGPYFPEGFKPVKILGMKQMARSWPGGYGDKKLGGNYAPTMKTMRLGKAEEDCDTALWLLGNKVLEMGSLNMFMYWKNSNGEDELITPPLDGTILPGITRDSILNIAKSFKSFKVTERSFTI